MTESTGPQVAPPVSVGTADVVSPDSSTAQVPVTPGVQQLIDRARRNQKQTQNRGSFRAGFGLTCCTAVLLWACFTPLELAPLAWIALVPLLQLVRVTLPIRGLYSAVFLGAFLFHLATLQWMRLGDPTMYIAWVALSVYLSWYWLVFVAVVRRSTLRWKVPLCVAVPIAWTGLELLRGHLISGFGWYLLGHSQYCWIDLIQISDLTGSYGVSFLVAMSSAVIAELIPISVLLRIRLWPATAPLPVIGLRLPIRPAVAMCVLVLAALGYGMYRTSQRDFVAGPRVALIQGNFPASARAAVHNANEVYIMHARLTALAVREQPQLIVWPETMFRWPLLISNPQVSPQRRLEVAPMVPPELWTDTTVTNALRQETERAGAPMIVGLEAVTFNDQKLLQYNSAALLEPGVGVSRRYDKIHLVPFGEYLPLRSWLPLLSQLTPYREDMGLEPGTRPAVFEVAGVRAVPIICFEDTVPHLVRRMVAGEEQSGRPVDLLVNLTNDGWFHGSSELNQHLITAAFRCVETRVPMVRAVNTGISAFIDGNGQILDPEVFLSADVGKGADPKTTARDSQTGRWKKQINAALVSTVPLDGRTSWYVRTGDWFAGGCLMLTLFAWGLLLWQNVLARWQPVPPVQA